MSKCSKRKVCFMITFSPNIVSAAAPNVSFCGKPRAAATAPAPAEEIVKDVKESGFGKKIVDAFKNLKENITKNGFVTKVKDFFKSVYEKVSKNETVKKVIDKTVEIYKKIKDSKFVKSTVDFIKKTFKTTKPVA